MVTDLGVYDFETLDRRMRLRSVHPSVTVDQAAAAAPFKLAVPDEVPVSRLPTEAELYLIRSVIDPGGARKADFRPRP